MLNKRPAELQSMFCIRTNKTLANTVGVTKSVSFGPINLIVKYGGVKLSYANFLLNIYILYMKD